MRIAQLVLNGEIAGGQTVALQLARAARAAGHEVVFISPTDGPFTELTRRDGFPTLVVPVRSSLDGRAVPRLRHALRDVDLLHTHAMIEVNVVARTAGRLAGVPVLSHMHIENFLPRGLRGRIVRFLDNATARLSTRIVAVSEDTRRALLRQGYPDRIEVVHNGVEPQPQNDDPGEGVVEVARLAPVKGQRELIEAVARIDGAHLTLVGDDLERGGAYADELRALADRLGVSDRIELTGRRDDAKELLGQAAVVALPSTTEGLPMTLLEAMARGRAVVATPVGGTPEVVDEQTGVLVPPGDVDALAAALDELLHDPVRRALLGAAGRARIEREFSLAQMTARFLELYAEI
jgi:glycosyltransferase involved in cell wall biosynthesis